MCGTKVHKEVQKMAEKILNSYETIFIIDATLDEETVTALKDKFTTLIEQNGELESVDEWGKRRLAYEINDRTEGFYYLVNFKADSEFPKELERQYNSWPISSERGRPATSVVEAKTAICSPWPP